MAAGADNSGAAPPWMMAAVIDRAILGATEEELDDAACRLFEVLEDPVALAERLVDEGGVSFAANVADGVLEVLADPVAPRGW